MAYKTQYKLGKHSIDSKNLMNTNLNNTCRNCNAPIGEAYKYCPQCSQKNTTGKESIGTFISEFISTTFNLDSKIFQSIAGLFIPGKLTKEYFLGKHKSYYHPLRFFLVVGLALFAVLASYVNKQENVFSLVDKDDEKKIYQLKTLKTIDSLKMVSDSISAPYFDSLTSVLRKNLVSSSDSTKLPTIMGPVVNTSGKAFLVAKKDILQLNTDELIERYELGSGRWNRAQFRQIIKVIKDGNSFATFLIGNIIWATLFMMLLLALILKLFYFRKGHYYVEHLIFSLHVHTFLFFLLFIIALFGNHISETISELLNWFIFLGFTIYIFTALKRYYQQSYPKTILKFVLIGISYLFLLFFILLSGFVIIIHLF